MGIGRIAAGTVDLAERVRVTVARDKVSVDVSLEGDDAECIDGISFVRLSGRDVVRHRIVQDIVDAYDKASANSPTDGRS